jgi:hypothetical protein
MESQSPDITINSIDIKLLAPLIVELNIARRNCSAYPKGHPVIASSLTKALRVYDELLSTRSELVIGVTSEALMVDGTVLEKTNLIYRDFSRALFERGIGALLFHRGLTFEELNNFTRILGLKREHILQTGGIEEVWGKANIEAIAIRPVRYDLFKTSDNDSVTGADTMQSQEESLWDRFAREITVAGMLGEDSGDIYLDPEVLADILNQQFDGGSIQEAAVRSAVSRLLASAENDAQKTADNSSQPYLKLATLISTLAPELRRQFLESSFGNNNQDNLSAAEHILTKLSDNTIIDTLEDISHNRLNVSPVVFGLLQRLGKNASAAQHSAIDVLEENNLSQKMKTIFREHASEEFVPDDYQNKLNHIITTDQIPRENMEEVADLLKSLEDKYIENSVGRVLMNLIREGIETPEERDLLLQNLSDMFCFYLQTGDYDQLHIIIDQISDGTFPAEIQSWLHEEYGRSEFLEEILNGLIIWGKPRYEDIRSLIHKIGGPFIELLLDRLSEENNMSLRRFYMDCLIKMGPLTRVPIANRLNDTRWYFLRNLLIIIFAQNDPSVVPLIRPLLRSEDPRLRHEVLKTLVHFRDPQSEKLVIVNMDSSNTELQMAAIHLAEHCKSPAIADKLAEMLSQGGLSQTVCDKKCAIVHALGEIGRAEVLPQLAKILSSRSLFHSRQLTKLKKDIIQSLPKYPVTVSRPVLEHIAKGSGDVARLAVETLKIISGKQR